MASNPKPSVKTIKAAPKAAQLIESMRDIGYSLETALADIIDNSITAGARTVKIYADTSSSEPCLAIIDDGVGMTGEKLIDAMHLGSCSPLEERKSSDLGRFGLGLKTASFSQCRRLTVVTRKNNKTECARWDLDHVESTNDWLIQIPSSSHGIPWMDKLGTCGTMVLWEKLDRLIAKGTAEYNSTHLVQSLDAACKHLELVFHRYLSPEKGTKKITVTINELPLEPFDPFHSTHPATVAGPVEKILVRGHTVVVQAFTLPHHKKVTSVEWEKYAGRAGYTKNQGFYLYRNKRLIIHGTWFGLARQTELTKLARVRIDMPNNLDADWKIDVKKASAHPPPQVRDRLRKTIERIGATSKLVYKSRGHKLNDVNPFPVWQRIQDKNEISYRVNQEHPVIQEFANNLTSELQEQFSFVVKMIGASIPIDALFADTGSTPESVTGDAMSIESLEHIIGVVLSRLREKNVATQDIKQMLQAIEPFRTNWLLTEQLLESLIKEADANV